MPGASRDALSAAGTLAAFAIAGALLVSLTWTATRERIAANEHSALTRELTSLLTPEHYDNDPLLDPIHLQSTGDPDGRPLTLYRAQRRGRTVAAFATIEAPDGYAGPIKLLVGAFPDGRLAGVRVLSHRETPGLGDAIDERRSDWILGFSGKSLLDPERNLWKVRRDGGGFDQFTGATVTPRAVVKAVYNWLLFAETHSEQVFGTPPAQESDD